MEECLPESQGLCQLGEEKEKEKMANALLLLHALLKPHALLKAHALPSKQLLAPRGKRRTLQA